MAFRGQRQSSAMRMQTRIEFFYSRICPHCEPVRRMLYEIAKDLDKVHIEEVDAWSEKGEPLAKKYGVHLVPTVVVNGIRCAEGIVGRQQLLSAIRGSLG